MNHINKQEGDEIEDSPQMEQKAWGESMFLDTSEKSIYTMSK